MAFPGASITEASLKLPPHWMRRGRRVRVNEATSLGARGFVLRRDNTVFFYTSWIYCTHIIPFWWMIVVSWYVMCMDLLLRMQMVREWIWGIKVYWLKICQWKWEKCVKMSMSVSTRNSGGWTVRMSSTILCLCFFFSNAWISRSGYWEISFWIWFGHGTVWIWKCFSCCCISYTTNTVVKNSREKVVMKIFYVFCTY